MLHWDHIKSSLRIFSHTDTTRGTSILVRHRDYVCLHLIWWWYMTFHIIIIFTQFYHPLILIQSLIFVSIYIQYGSFHFRVTKRITSKRNVCTHVPFFVKYIHIRMYGNNRNNDNSDHDDDYNDHVVVDDELVRLTSVCGSCGRSCLLKNSHKTD